MKKILVTGAKGFVGKNLIAELKKRGYTRIYEYDKDTDIVFLDAYTGECDFVFHLAGVNRPEDDSEFDTGNWQFTCDLLAHLKKHNKTCPIVFSSSIQAELDNPYGNSKKAGEDELFAYAQTTGTRVMVYRLPNLFGKWCRPNYNSVVATFCYNISRNYDIKINDPNAELTLCYIDDVVNEFIHALEGNENREGQFCRVAPVYKVRVGGLAEKLYSFKNNLEIIVPTNDLDKAMYNTYLSYLPDNDS